MKKVININFKGRVIPIEETAFEQLQNYIESLRRYFQHEEGRDEIVNDIEDRIAELFDEELKKGASCITDEGVNTILDSMGRVQDFEQMDSEPSVSGSSSSTNERTYERAQEEPRGSMHRNENDKVVGGVCSGIAHYLKIDPTVIRVLFVLFSLSYGAGLLIYIILWAVLPSKELKSNIKKRLFRDSDQRVIGGVASGLANYFNIAVWIPRVIFALPFILGALSSIFRSALWWGFDSDFKPLFFTGGFGGTLFLTYIVLWIVLPKASSPTEKLQMRGEKIDVGSISKAVKEDLKRMGDDVKTGAQRVGEEMKSGAQRMGDEVKERSQAFASEARPIAQKTSTGIGNAIGILFKIFFLFIAGSVAFGLLMALFGISVAGIVVWPLKDFFFDGNSQNLAVWGTLLLFLFVPVIAFFVWIIRKIFNIRSKNSYLGWVFGGLWTLGWVFFIFLVSGISKNFRQRETVEQNFYITQPPAKRMILTVTEPKLHYSGHYWWMDADDEGFDIDNDSIRLNTVRVRLEQSKDSQYYVSIIKSSYGSSKSNARDRAEKIGFRMSYKDSILDLGNYMAIGKTEKFRGQNVEVVVSIPVNGKVYIDKSVERKLHPVNYKFSRWNRKNDDWDIDIYTELDYTPDVDYIMTKEGLRREDGKKEDTYEYRYNKKDTEELNQEMKDIEKQKEEIRQKEEELRKKIDTGKYRYQPVTNKPKETKQMAQLRNSASAFYQPITVSAL